jgi:flagellin-specific chaperone FliS
MGGRRSYSMNSFISKGPAISAKKASLTRAFKKEDLDAITTASIKLGLEHQNIASIFIYSEKLLRSIQSKYSPEEVKSVEEIVKRVRLDWSRLKKDLNITPEDSINQAVIYSVSSYLKKRHK